MHLVGWNDIPKHCPKHSVLMTTHPLQAVERLQDPARGFGARRLWQRGRRGGPGSRGQHAKGWQRRADIARGAHWQRCQHRLGRRRAASHRLLAPLELCAGRHVWRVHAASRLKRAANGMSLVEAALALMLTVHAHPKNITPQTAPPGLLT